MKHNAYWYNRPDPLSLIRDNLHPLCSVGGEGKAERAADRAIIVSRLRQRQFRRAVMRRCPCRTMAQAGSVGEVPIGGMSFGSAAADGSSLTRSMNQTTEYTFPPLTRSGPGSIVYQMMELLERGL